YDVLRTTSPQFPSAPGNFALATGVTQTTYLDQGTPPTSYNPTGLTYGAPASRRVHLNNRDYPQPMIELDAVRVASITFPVGSCKCSAGGGGSQSPWTSDIDGAGHSLLNAKSASLGLTFAPPNPGSLFLGGAGNAQPAQVAMLNDAFNGLTIEMNGTTA